METASRAFLRVATLARETREGLEKDVAQLGIGKWKGTAAAAFRNDVRELPTRLGEVDESYETAGRALHAFHLQLERSQGEARAARTAAEQAEADRKSAQQRLDGARMEAGALRSQRRSANAKLLAVQTQQAVTIDPAQRSSLDASVASARSRSNRLHAEVKAADQTVTRHETSVREAEARLKQAQADATRIRERMNVYVDGAVGALKQAEKYGNLPSFTERFAADAKNALVVYGPVVADSFQKGSEWFSIAGTLFPPGAAVFKSASLIVGGLGVIVLVASEAASDDGITLDDGLKIGGRALTVLATAAGLKGASKAVGAARWATASKVADYAGDAVHVAEQTRQHGTEGLLIGVGGIVVSRGGEKLAGAALRRLTPLANKSPVVTHLLDGLTEQTGHSDSKVLGVPLVSDMDSRAGQSLFSAGRRDGGEFLFGNRAATNPSPADHIMGAKELSELQDHVAGVLPTEAAGWLEDKRLDDDQKSGTATEREIDIDLHPSPYGGGR